MNNKEKMLAGELYDATDAELAKERLLAKDMCYEFNNLRPSDLEAQTKLFHSLLGKSGENISIMGPFYCDYGYNIEVGENFFANHNTVILDCAKVVFGDNVLIGPNCGFYTAGHPVNYRERNACLEYAKSIRVGNNVWVGAGVHVMPGVTIGSNVVIAGGSVVVKDVPDNVMVAGNPCHIIKRLEEVGK